MNEVARLLLELGPSDCLDPVLAFAPLATRPRRSRVPRRVGRAVEGARLESVCRETYRGFESHTLRH